MAAPPKVSVQAICNALLRWRGDVTAAARALGLSRNGLYQRITRAEINLDGYRQVIPGRAHPFGEGLGPVRPNLDTTVSTPPTVHMVPTQSVNVPARAHVAARANLSARGNCEDRGSASRVSAVQEAMADTNQPPPIKTAPPRRLPPLRLPPDVREKLQRVARQFMAAFNCETDESLVLQQFIEEDFESWASAKLPIATAKKRSGGGAQ